MAQKRRRTLEELNLLDRFLFDETMEDAGTYQNVLEIILGHEIDLKDNSQSEKEIRTIPAFRGIRLDVWGRTGPERFIIRRCRRWTRRIISDYHCTF